MTGKCSCTFCDIFTSHLALPPLTSNLLETNHNCMWHGSLKTND